jgi:hypothetical protein
MGVNLPRLLSTLHYLWITTVFIRAFFQARIATGFRTVPQPSFACFRNTGPESSTIDELAR